MITQAVLTVLLLPVTLLLSVIPSVSWPAWFQTSGSGSVVAEVGVWGGHLATVNGWFPVAAFVDSLGIVFVCAGVAVGIKVARIVLSAVTGGGGSAA